MSQLSADRGSQLVSLEDLKSIPVPEPTKSYTPVGHYDLANSISTIGQDLLSDYTLVSEEVRHRPPRQPAFRPSNL